MPVPVLIASVALQGYGMYQQNKSAKASANLANDTAEYNARVDLAEAKQIELDTDANVRAARRDASVYTSRQRAAYAASGVLATGSALAVQAETAGRIEQGILQERSNSQREVSKRESAAAMGVLYGKQTADAIKRESRLNMLKGGIGILSTVAGAYDSGVFAGTSTRAGSTSANMLAAGAPSAVATRYGT